MNETLKNKVIVYESHLIEDLDNQMKGWLKLITDEESWYLDSEVKMLIDAINLAKRMVLQRKLERRITDYESID